MYDVDDAIAVGRTTRRVVLRSATPEPDLSPVPEPASPVAIGEALRVGGHLEVAITDDACPVGSELYVSATVRPLRVPMLGRWWNPTAYGFAERAGRRCPAPGSRSR